MREAVVAAKLEPAKLEPAKLEPAKLEPAKLVDVITPQPIQ
jgi:hypothetical protein